MLMVFFILRSFVYCRYIMVKFQYRIQKNHLDNGIFRKVWW